MTCLCGDCAKRGFVAQSTYTAAERRAFESARKAARAKRKALIAKQAPKRERLERTILRANEQIDKLDAELWKLSDE